MTKGMSVVTLKAHYDGKHICLDEPIDLPANAELMVTVLPDAGESIEAERTAWLKFSQENFARAYGDDEPDYSHCIGKAPPSE
jgi:hypothetical protein